MTDQPSGSDPVFNKTDVIRRQIDTAIWLWFNDGDIVSITQLTDAAFGVLDELYQKNNWGRPMPFDDDPSRTTPEQRKWRDKLREAAAFAKHARHDHDKSYEFNPIFNESYLAFAITAHSRLENVGPESLQTVFSLWFWLHFPEFVIRHPPLPFGFEVDQLRKLSRREFFEKFGGDFIGNPNVDWRLNLPPPVRGPS